MDKLARHFLMLRVGSEQEFLACCKLSTTLKEFFMPKNNKPKVDHAFSDFLSFVGAQLSLHGGRMSIWFLLAVPGSNLAETFELCWSQLTLPRLSCASLSREALASSSLLMHQEAVDVQEACIPSADLA